MKHSLFFCFVLLSCAASCQDKPDNSITIGKTIELYSKTLHETRRVMIYLPDSYYDTYFYKRRYPVIYALDGDSHFYQLAAMLKLMGSGPDFPEMILVSIPNTDRVRDLTPSRDTTGFGMDANTAHRTGGGEAFLSFMAQELIPRIDSLYPDCPLSCLYRSFARRAHGDRCVGPS